MSSPAPPPGASTPLHSRPGARAACASGRPVPCSTGSGRWSRAGTVGPRSARAAWTVPPLGSVSRPGDRLDLEVLLEAGDAVLASDTALLVPAEGHVGEVAGTTVQTDEPGPQFPGHGEGPLQRAGHDVAGQPVEAVVGDAQGVRLVLE